VIQRPDGLGVFEFAVLASLRASQLCRGCSPRVDGDHNVAVTAQMEVAGGIIMSVPATVPTASISDASVATGEV